MALTKDQVTLITVAALGKAPGANHLNYFTTSATAGEFKVNGGTTNINTLLPYASDLEAVAAVLQHERSFLEGKNNLAPQTDAEFVASVVANLGAADGASLAADLQGGMARYKALVKFALAEDAKGPIANVTNATGSLDDVEQNLIDTGTPANPGNEIYLTVGSDRNVATTAGDDVIVANVVNNDLGILVNELSTGDVIDGGAGFDVLKASLVRDNRWDNDIDPRPTVKNVEEIRIEALENVTLDADRISNELHYASDRSRSDLTITNVAIEGNQITQDITLEMKNTIANNSNLSLNSATPGMGSNFNVYFDETSLRAKRDLEEANAEFYIQLADSLQEDAAAPLTNVRITDLIVKHDGNTITLSNIESDDNTYEGLVRAVQAALDDAGFGGRYKAELGAEFNEVANVATKVPGFNVVVKDTNEPAVSFAEEDVLIGVGNKIGSGSSASVQGDSGVDFDTSKQTFKVTSDIILDGVGRGSNGGDLTIGSMSTSNSSTGVQVFDIEVRNNSNLGDFYSTNGALEELRIVNGVGYKGDLTLRNELNDSNNANSINGGEKILVESFAGNINLGTVNAIKNVDVIDARVTGNVTLNAEYDGNGLASNNQKFAINTGTGNDTITASVVGTSTSGSTLTELTVTATGGNNTITLSSDDTEASKAEVITGSGADTVTGGATHLTANTGAGNDVIYAENTGAKAFAQLAAGGTVSTTAGLISATAVNGSEVLNGRTVQVTVAMPEDASSIPATAFAKGYEVTAEIKAASGVLTTERDLYEAAAKAINNDPVVNKLVKASVDSKGILSVQYLVDGATTAADSLVKIEVLGDWADVSTSDQNKIVTALQKKYKDSAITSVDVGNLYDNVNTLSEAALQIAAVPGVAAVFTFNETALRSANDQLTFTIDGESTTIDFHDDWTANLVDAEVEIGGVIYTLGGVAGAFTLTANSFGAVDGTLTVTDENGNSVVGAQTTLGVDAVSLGTDATTGGVNKVNGGTGDDVIVLSSNDTTIDTVVFEGSFGNDTIVHFNDAAGGDVLDFSAYLTNVISVSGSTDSQVRAAGTLTANNAMTENSVSIIDFADIVDNDAGAATALNFDTMTTTQLLAEMNAGQFAASATSASLVGTKLQSIVMIEDSANALATDDNEGFYKVYAVTYDTVSGDFTAATLVGTVDFGDTLNVAGMNSTNIA